MTVTTVKRSTVAQPRAYNGPTVLMDDALSELVREMDAYPECASRAFVLHKNSVEAS